MAGILRGLMAGPAFTAGCVREGASGSLPVGARLPPDELRVRAAPRPRQVRRRPTPTVQGPAVLRVGSATAATLLALPGDDVFAISRRSSV